jgi:YD repeat-containing protein
MRFAMLKIHKNRSCLTSNCKNIEIIRTDKAPILAALFLLVMAFSAPAVAQNVKYTTNTADQSHRGSSHVNPSTLGMTFSLPLTEYPGRGTGLPVTVSYLSKVWRMDLKRSNLILSAGVDAKYAEHSTSGWTSSLGVPVIEYTGATQPYKSDGSPFCTVCTPTPTGTRYYIDRLLIHMPDGSTHELRKSDTPVLSLSLTGIYYAVDGSRLRYDADNAVLYLPDGSRYLLIAPGGVQYIDRNGDTLSFNSSSKQWTDTLGRVISQPPLNNSAQGNYVYTLPGVGGAMTDYIFRWRNLADVRTDPSQPLRYPGDYDQSIGTVSPSLFNGQFCGCSGEVVYTYQQALFNPAVLWQIELPNGSKYTFTYNIFGEIDKVQLPTGGYERFEYANVPGISYLAPDENGLYSQGNRGVVKHWISATGSGSDEVLWQYSVNATFSPAVFKTTVIAPNNARTERYLHAGLGASGVLNAVKFGLDDARSGEAYEESAYAASGQMIRRTLVDWTMDSAQLAPPFQFATATRNPRGVKKVEILLDTGGNALAATTTTGHDADMNEIAANRYDFVSISSTTGQTGDINSFPLGTLLRTEEKTFLVNDTNIAQATRDAYRARNLIALPSYTRVKNGSVIVAETQFKYDEAAYPLLTYGSTPTGWTNPNANERGNVTTVRRWLNVSGSTVQTYPNGSFLETHAQYDQCGNVRNAWDANGKLLQMNYADNFSDGIDRNTFAYATSSTTPVPDSTGYFGSNESFTSNSKFDFQSGKIVTTTDANNKTTSYFYTDDGGVLDSLQRLRRVTLPEGLGETKYEFGDTPGNLYVRTLTKQNATTWLDDYTYFDGMGRAKRSGHYEGPGSWSVKDTEYDSLGRVKRVTNPYFAANLSGATPGNAEWTTSAYDDLNRVLTVTAPDGAVVQTTYSGNQVTVRDPANKKRRSMTDALGRLAQLVEDPDGVAYQANYSYDLLGNLTIVNQGGQLR